MTTTIPTHIGKRAGALTQQRTVACPTCHAPIGAFCVSLGQHGSTAGNIMSTSCHNARIIAAGLTPRSFHKDPRPATSTPTVNSLSVQKREHAMAGGKMSDFKPKPVKVKGTKNQRISHALKLSWAKRKQEEAEAALKFSLPKIKLDSSKAPVKSGARTHMLRVGHPQNYKSVVEGQVNNIDLSKLIQSALATLEAGAKQVDLSVVGVGEVIGHDHNLAENEQDKTYYTLLVKR